MVHTLTPKKTSNWNDHISVTEEQNKVIIHISRGDEIAFVELDKQELHSFIGTLLHVQAKMKGGQNV